MQNKGSIITIGSVLSADIRGFVVASRIPEPDVPTFGTFVNAPIQQAQASVIGIVYDIRLEPDPFLRGIAATVNEADEQYREVIADQREVRLLPVEISAISVGYRDNEGYQPGLPPQPPMLLHQITVCTKEEVNELTQKPDFLHILLESRDVPADELIITVLQRTARLRPEQEREQYLLSAARYLARYLGKDPLRLGAILERIQPRT
ncbi:MAG: hypothetical protein JW981_10515 [Anaerolineae bacterium]|nr:hypothetical protein [Anaerolineae bacterium]